MPLLFPQRANYAAKKQQASSGFRATHWTQSEKNCGMKRVTGIGGIFFKGQNAEQLRAKPK
jgi:hypothetical protein